MNRRPRKSNFAHSGGLLFHKSQPTSSPASQRAMARLLEALDDLGSGSGSSSGSGSGFGFDGPTVVELPERLQLLPQ